MYAHISGRRQWGVTEYLILANVIVYIILSIAALNPIDVTGSFLFYLLAQVNFLVYEGFVYQLFTAMFVHLNILHLLSNMFFLYLFGKYLEGLFPRRTYLLVYFGGGLLGNILTLALGPYLISGGASGAIFSIYAFLIVITYKTNQRSFRSILFVLILMLMLNSGLNTNSVAHAGGALFGLLYGYYILKRRFIVRRAPEERYYEYSYSSDEFW